MPSVKNGFFLKKFLDFDKIDKKFYINYYLDDFKIVLKDSLNKENTKSCDFMFDRFNLEKYIYLIHFI